MIRLAENEPRGPWPRTAAPIARAAQVSWPSKPVAPLLAAAVWFVLATGASTLGQTYDGPSSGTGSNGNQERIHLGDVVDVDFIGSFEFDWRGSLTGEGFLNGLDRAEKPVFALCRTEAEVASAVAEQFRYFLRDPRVAVRIIDRSNRALAYVTGAVRNPQRLQLRRSVSLLELIVLAGGVTDSSNGEIVVFRPPAVSCSGGDGSKVNGEPKRLSIRMSDLLGGNAEANPPIVSGDVVNVIESQPVFVTGDVASPRRMNLTPELTLSRAVASAGGVSLSFSGQKARVHRRKPESRVLEFDLRRILEKKAEDPKLEPYDVIEVEQKGVEPRRLAAIPESAAPGAESMLKLPLRIVD